MKCQRKGARGGVLTEVYGSGVNASYHESPRKWG